MSVTDMAYTSHGGGWSSIAWDSDGRGAPVTAMTTITAALTVKQPRSPTVPCGCVADIGSAAPY